LPAMSYGAGHLWVVCNGSSRGRFIERIDPLRGRVDARTPVVPGSGDEWIIAGSMGTWYSTDAIKTTKVDPSGRRLDRLTVNDAGKMSTLNGAQPTMGAGALWVLSHDETIAKIDPATGRIVRYFTYRAFDPTYTAGAESLVVGFGSLWVMSPDLLRLSQQTGHVEARVRLALTGGIIAISAKTVWIGTL